MFMSNQLSNLVYQVVDLELEDNICPPAGWNPTLIPSWKKNGDHMVFYSSTAGKLKTPWRQTDVKVLVGNPNRWIPPTKKSILLDIQKTCIEIHFQCPFAHLQSPASGTRWK